MHITGIGDIPDCRGLKLAYAPRLFGLVEEAEIDVAAIPADPNVVKLLACEVEFGVTLCAAGLTNLD